MMAGLLQTYIERHQKEKLANETRPMRKLHPSTIGMCKRKIVFDMLMVPKPETDPQLIRIFENGHSMHHRYEKLFADMGILVQAEMKLERDDISGHTDALISIPSFLNPFGEKFLVELKSAFSHSFKWMKENNKPKAEHKAQLTFYMHLSGIHKGIIFVEEKDTQDVWEYHMNYDPVYGKKLEQKANECIQLAKDRKLPPLEKGYTPSNYKCKDCPFNIYCHSDSAKNDGSIRNPNPFNFGSEAYKDVENIRAAIKEGRPIPDVITGDTNGDLVREVAEKNITFSKVD
ncbi:hypothetical protein [Paenibacillus sp. TCA20]|uniref:hypothetical protein n=1 Tax=Paenibacillus sp. TCA20 TaxID=1499968 RepID=UPI000B2AA2FE|nr:hypothetical protein [Paenibacillus sp. TCA20]